jgi:hypothetical protein
MWRNDFQACLIDACSGQTHRLNDAKLILQQNCPKRLYKFRAVSAFALDNLRSNTAWMCSANKLNDPYDCLLTLDVLRHLNIVEKNFKPAKWNWNSFEFGLSASQMKLFFRQMLNLDGVQALTNICSFTESNKPLNLWAYYAADHTGFCLEYDPSNFPTVLRGSLSPVLYRDDFPDLPLDSPASIILRALIKARSWEPEQEWRLVDFPGTGEGKNIGLGKPAAVYLGARMPAPDRGTVVAICEEIEIPCYQMVMAFDRFELLVAPLPKGPSVRFASPLQFTNPVPWLQNFTKTLPPPSPRDDDE